MPRGFGSIRKLRDGRWQASIYIAGRRERHIEPKKDLARVWLDEKRLQRVEAASGAVLRHGNFAAATYDQAGDALLRQYEAGTRRVHTHRTLESYRSELAAVLADWKNRRIAGTRPGDVDDWVRQLRRRGLSTSSIRHRLDRLSALHQAAVRQGWLASVPCRVERPRLVMRSEPDAMSEADLGKLLVAASRRELVDVRPLAIVLLGADAGLRVGEMARLRRQDLRDGFLHVAVRSETDRTKSGRGRDVPIETKRLRRALAALGSGAPGDPLLLGLRSESGITYCVAEVWKKALGTTPRLHSLRHRYCTRLAEAGVPLPRLAALAGHRTVTTTMRYVHIVPGADRALQGILEGRSDRPRATRSRPVPRETRASRSR